MVKLFKETKRPLMLGCFSLILLSSNAMAACFTLQNPLTCGKFYVGGFGGIGYSDNINLTQTGTIFSPTPVVVNVHVHGRSDTTSALIWGLQTGYRWNGWKLCDDYCFIPAVEIEGFYLGPTTQRGNLINPSAGLPNSFQDSFPLHAEVFLANTIWSFKVPSFNCFYPYIGGGVGTANVSISGAYSAQVAPVDPNINRFNSNTGASDWTFAAQGKAGFRYDMTKHWKLFTEYRFLYLSPTRYTFGSTQYPARAPTTKWNVTFNSLKYHMGIVGIEYDI